MTEANSYDEFKGINLLEKHRVMSFKEWPFEDQQTCSVSKMAEAGFYWSGNENEKDTVTCFVCAKTLDGWEATDNPWAEHAKHAPQCMFVKYGCQEKDLSVEQFLNIFGSVVKSRLLKRLDKQKKQLTDLANKELDVYMEKNKH